ncbi:fluoride efflux transporter FluC [Rhodoluna lacicola]|uniref:fluoride efflux transporter FluC n=1 Tax=Rhodoluna lacicola TaxID=529884 RepID=UPI00222FCA88|nr:CrcB family protein [Rhodoluna lacicola]BDS49884.1 camphor resistance protein CrcB [Rhodoluna lacicola]
MSAEFSLLVFGVAVAGGLGAVLRLYLAQWQGKLPWGILAGNLLASVLVGLFSASQIWFLAIILITGLAGGLSTFSSFAAQTVEFMRRGRIAQGLLNILANLLLSSTAVLLGQALATGLLK